MEGDRRGGLDRRALGLGLGGLGAASLWSPAWPQALPSVPDVPAARPESVGMNSAALAKIAPAMQGHIDAGRIQGAVTAIARRGKLVHFEAHGWSDIEAKTPMKTDAVFVMMSSTKPVTAVALLQQIEAGKVSLDDKVSKFIPELKDMRVRQGPPPPAGPPAAPDPSRPPSPPAGPPPPSEPAAREITVRDLATHTSGLNASAVGRGATLAEAVPKLKDSLLDFQPGSRWAYSATGGPDVLARIVEIVSGTTYDRYLRDHVTGPVGMSETSHNLTPAQAARLVTRYQRTDGAWVKTRGAGTPPAHTNYFAGSFGLFSTARDYLQFESMLLAKGSIHGKRVLRPQSIELMRTNMVGDLFHGVRGELNGHGFGVLVRTIVDAPNCGCSRSEGAFGWYGAYGTVSWTDPKSELVAVLMLQQNDYSVHLDYERLIREAIVA